MIKIGIFSGRFDPPNMGHIMTIERLIEEYHYLVIPILDYSNREGCTAKEAKTIFEHHFGMIIPKMFKNRFKFIINNDHFAEITILQFSKLLNSVGLNVSDNITYLAGNEMVIKHMMEIGIKTKFVLRVIIDGLDQYTFESTKIREEIKKKGKSLDCIYNIGRKN